MSRVFTITKRIAKHGKQSIMIIPSTLKDYLKEGMLIRADIQILDRKIKKDNNQENEQARIRVKSEDGLLQNKNPNALKSKSNKRDGSSPDNSKIKEEAFCKNCGKKESWHFGTDVGLFCADGKKFKPDENNKIKEKSK